MITRTLQTRRTGMGLKQSGLHLPARITWGPTLVFLVVPLFIQSILGANLVVLLITLFIAILSLFGFWLLGAYNAAGWLSLLFVMSNILVALYAKTLLGQPLDLYLYSPVESFIILFVGTVSLVIALVLVRSVPIGRPLFLPVDDPRFLRFLSIATFFIGVLFWALNAYYSRQIGFTGPKEQGFGGFAVFRALLLMGVIAGTAEVLEQSNGRRSLNTRILVMLGASFVMGMIDNSKTSIAMPVASYFATSLFYRSKLTWNQLGVALGFVIVLALVAGPAIHFHRAADIQGLTFGERIAYLRANWEDITSPGTLALYQEVASLQFRGGYYDYFGSGHQMLLGRFTSIQQIDPVITEVNRQGTLGGSVLWPAFARLVPGFLYPDKPAYVESYHILVRLGLILPEGGKFPTVPLIAQTYAAYGTAGLLIIPFVTFFVFLLMLKKLGWRLYRNVYAIFFFCVFIVLYTAQGSFGQYIGSVLRNFPLLAVVLLVLGWSYRRLLLVPRS